MRNHDQIIRDAGEDKIAALTASSIHTVRSWVQRKSIPAPHWAALVQANLCQPDELMTAAAAKRAA